MRALHVHNSAQQPAGLAVYRESADLSSWGEGGGTVHAKLAPLAQAAAASPPAGVSSPPAGVLPMEVLGAEVADDGDARGDEGGDGLDAPPVGRVREGGEGEVGGRARAAVEDDDVREGGGGVAREEVGVERLVRVELGLGCGLGLLGLGLGSGLG